MKPILRGSLDIHKAVSEADLIHKHVFSWKPCEHSTILQLRRFYLYCLVVSNLHPEGREVGQSFPNAGVGLSEKKKQQTTNPKSQLNLVLFQMAYIGN